MENEMEKIKSDPYLVPGQACVVWHKGSKFRQVGYFLAYQHGQLLFTQFIHMENGPYGAVLPFDCYRPITEWDYAPVWAEATAINKEGRFLYFKKLDAVLWKNQYWKSDDQIMKGGLCHDENRVRNWKDSLRRRPYWAGRK